MTFEARSIVCGVDFSPASMAALWLALELARKHGGSVRAVHAYLVPLPPCVETGIATVDEARLTEQLESEPEAAIRQRAPGIPVSWRAAPGWPAPVLLREAHEARADVIAIGTRGLTGLPRFLLGTVAERVARTSPIPVLVAPEPSDDSAPRRLRTLLCAVAFSVPSAAALRAAASLASTHGAAVHVVHAWVPAAYVARHEELASAHERDLCRMLEAEVERAWLDPRATPCSVRRGRPYAAIVEHAREIGADWIVVGNTGRSGPRHFLLGSVAERVLRVSPVPVLVVRRTQSAP